MKDGSNIITKVSTLIMIYSSYYTLWGMKIQEEEYQ
jgi:hypothetical protein